MNLPNKQAILDELASCITEADTQAFHVKYLGKKGTLSGLFKTLGTLDPEQRKEAGKQIKVLFDDIQAAFDMKQQDIKTISWNAQLTNDLIDWSLPGTKVNQGHLTLLSKTRRRVEDIFQGMGFHIAYGHDMVTQWENFSSVNIPASHPATEMHDTLYIDQTDEQGKPYLMRTHTSAHQVELIKQYGLPCKFVVPGKVYRNEKMDASHDCVFWQVEGVVIDKNISIAHFKHMMQQILSAILEQEVEMRLRPSYFPFVEPGFEIDAKATVGKHEKRLEILGAGMIHPEVLKNADIDPDEYSGFAFGLGLTRLVAIRYGLHDIRLLTNGDLRFTRSFK